MSLPINSNPNSHPNSTPSTTSTSVPISTSLDAPHARAFPRPSRHCDLFCTVIDNFGDAAVCWRLACQLTRERGWQVRLFIDHPEVLAALRGADEPAVQVVPWPSDIMAWPSSDLGDVVIEAFACTLPAGFITAMADHPTPPVWINLEYLSAEDWVQDCHLGRSPHPRLPLTKTFFFPGMAEGTGGLLREHNLHGARQRFLVDTQAQNALWSRLGMRPPTRAAGSLIITLFAYENPAIESLLDQWSDTAMTCFDGARTITLVVPVGRVSPQVAKYLGQSSLPAGTAVARGRLSVHAVPFVSQDDYDRLLWLADLNFVRGEDSFVRAQWAEQPFVWQIYPQADNAHLEKLDAALALYLAPLPDTTREAVRHFWHAWNAPISPTVSDALSSIASCERPFDAPPALPLATQTTPLPNWIAFWQQHAVLRKRAGPWAAALQCPGSLSANLADFVESQLK